MTKGTGPIPMANDLNKLLSADDNDGIYPQEKTYAINAITATLARVTAPLSSPTPTPTSERMAPVADRDKSFFRPKRCAGNC